MIHFEKVRELIRDGSYDHEISDRIASGEVDDDVKHRASYLLSEELKAATERVKADPDYAKMRSLLSLGHCVGIFVEMWCPNTPEDDSHRDCMECGYAPFKAREMLLGERRDD